MSAEQSCGRCRGTGRAYPSMPWFAVACPDCRGTGRTDPRKSAA